MSQLQFAAPTPSGVGGPQEEEVGGYNAEPYFGKRGAVHQLLVLKRKERNSGATLVSIPFYSLLYFTLYF